jgi:hypothetical protein
VTGVLVVPGAVVVTGVVMVARVAGVVVAVYRVLVVVVDGPPRPGSVMCMPRYGDASDPVF